MMCSFASGAARRLYFRLLRVPVRRGRFTWDTGMAPNDLITCFVPSSMNDAA
jgi:hypothetical protein